MHIKAAITHGNGQQIQVEVKVKSGGRFIPVETRINKHQMKTKTDVDIPISNPGEYRLRVRPQRKDGRWTAWTNFFVDTPMKHRSQLSLQKTTHEVRRLTQTVQRIREGEFAYRLCSIGMIISGHVAIVPFLLLSGFVVMGAGIQQCSEI